MIKESSLKEITELVSRKESLNEIVQSVELGFTSNFYDLLGDEKVNACHILDAAKEAIEDSMEAFIRYEINNINNKLSGLGVCCGEGDDKAKIIEQWDRFKDDIEGELVGTSWMKREVFATILHSDTSGKSIRIAMDAMLKDVLDAGWSFTEMLAVIGKLGDAGIGGESAVKVLKNSMEQVRINDGIENIVVNINSRLNKNKPLSDRQKEGLDRFMESL